MWIMWLSTGGGRALYSFEPNFLFQPRHWKTIFLGMGEQFDPEHEFIVDELLSYNLGAHSRLINTVYSAAVAEFAIEQRLVKVQRLWEDMEFKLAKFIPESVLKRGEGVISGLLDPSSPLVCYFH